MKMYRNFIRMFYNLTLNTFKLVKILKERLHRMVKFKYYRYI